MRASKTSTTSSALIGHRLPVAGGDGVVVFRKPDSRSAARYVLKELFD